MSSLGIGKKKIFELEQSNSSLESAKENFS